MHANSYFEQVIARLCERFYAKVDRSGGDAACHLWIASLMPGGYGQFGHDGRTIGAHRMAWMLVHGLIPDGLSVLHRCDVRRCCNVAHLFIGTQQDNMRDMAAKGRGGIGPNRARGERAGLSKITEAMAIEIRNMYATTSITQVALAEQFGIVQSAISAIIRGETWAHVDGERSDGEQRNRGEANRLARLNEEIVREMRATYAAGGVTQREIADRLGVCVQTVNLVLLRKTWSHVV